MDVPDTLNLEHLRSGGPQPGEVLQPQDDEGPTPMDATTAAPVDANEAALIAEVVGMGFSENGARRAIAATGVGGSAGFQFSALQFQCSSCPVPGSQLQISL